MVGNDRSCRPSSPRLLFLITEDWYFWSHRRMLAEAARDAGFQVYLATRVQKLGDAIRGLAGRHSAVLLANHGPVVAGKTLEAAVYATEELEATAKLYLLLHGRNPRVLDDPQIDELRQAFGLDY